MSSLTLHCVGGQTGATGLSGGALPACAERSARQALFVSNPATATCSSGAD